MIDAETFAERIFEVYDSHTGDLCPWSATDLQEVLNVLGDDTSEEGLEAAFEEANLWMGGLDDADLFFEDLSTLLSEDVFSFA